MKINCREDGRWCATYTDNGKRRYIYGKSKAEVERKLRDRLAGETVAQFLGEWLKYNRSGWAEKTYESYEQMIRVNIEPYIGTIQLDQLSPSDVQDMLQKLLDKELSNRTVEYAGKILSRALNWGKKLKKVEENVVDFVRLPRVERFRVEPLTPEQAQRLLDTIKGHRLEFFYHLALGLGLRRGELLRLRWQDVDFERKKLIVYQSKTHAGERTLPLTQTMADALKAHQQKQAEEKQDADDWQEHELVFCTSRGTPYLPCNIDRHFKSALQQAGLPAKRLHDMRHSCAAYLIAAGVNMHVVKQILGHTRASFTSDIYGHLLDGVDRAAVDSVEKLLQGSSVSGVCQLSEASESGE